MHYCKIVWWAMHSSVCVCVWGGGSGLAWHHNDTILIIGKAPLFLPQYTGNVLIITIQGGCCLLVTPILSCSLLAETCHLGDMGYTSFLLWSLLSLTTSRGDPDTFCTNSSLSSSLHSNANKLMDSFDYFTLLTLPPSEPRAVWQQVDLDSNNVPGMATSVSGN
jgi:hypothetical protein